jgi:iron complex outermembrane recepter protein
MSKQILQRSIQLLGAMGITALLPTQAVNAQSASAAAMLEEVVVTARRREENLQDLPMSIQAFSADALEAQGIINIEEIGDFVPNVSLGDATRANDTRLFIRGVGGGFSNPAQVFGVGTYIDGHYMSGSLGAFMSTVDIERVEVLRGPQGTLFGKNTTGGAISLVTAKPHDQFDGYIQGRTGSYGRQDVRLMANVPLSDNLFMRANFAREYFDGYYKNAAAADFPTLDANTGGEEQTSFGFALRYLPSNQLTVDFRLMLAQDRDENQGGLCRAYPDAEVYGDIHGVTFDGPDGLAGTADDVTGNLVGVPEGGYADGEGFWGGGIRLDKLYKGANANFLNYCASAWEAGDKYTTYQDYNTFSNVDNNMAFLDVTYEPTDGMIGPLSNASVQLKGGLRYVSYSYQQDRDMGPGIIDHVGNAPTDGRGVNRYTDEFEVILTGNLTDRLTLTSGFYYFDEQAQSGNRTCLSQWLDAADPLDFPEYVCTPEGGTFFHRLPVASEARGSGSFGWVSGRSTALFSHVTYELSDSLTLAMGARAMKDDRAGRNIELPADRGSCLSGYGAGASDPLNMCNPTWTVNPTTLGDNLAMNASAEYSDVTPMISLTKQLAPSGSLDSGMIYASYSEGYLTGAFNDELNAYGSGLTSAQSAAIQSIIAYDPEYIANYEAGFKGTLAGGNLRVSSSIFFMDYTDKQENIALPNPDGVYGQDENYDYTTNAADVSITGIEVEVKAVPWDNGFASINFGMLNSEYSDFKVPDLDNPTGPYVDVSASSINNRTPDWTFTAVLEHAINLGNGATLTPQVSMYSQAGMEYQSGLNEGEQSSATRGCYQDSLAKFRVRATYLPAAGNWKASLWGNNVTDESVMYECTGTRSGAMRYMYEAPAMWGADFTMNFGG